MATGRDMRDAGVLAGVFLWSAVHCQELWTRVLFSCAAAAVLLINGLFLHPVHAPSVLVAAAALVLPAVPPETMYREFRRAVLLLVLSPFLVLEALVGLVLVWMLVRYAVVRPILQARRRRRDVVPISRVVAEGSDGERRNPQHIVAPQRLVAELEAEKAAEVAESSVETSIHDAPGPDSVDAARREAQEEGRESPVLGQRDVSRLLLEAEVSSSAANPSAAGNAKGRDGTLRRRRPPTASQLAATKLMEEKYREERMRAEAVERKNAMRNAVEAERIAARKQAIEEREALQTQVRQTAEEVGDAKRALTAAMVNAENARMARRRAGDQARISHTPENEAALDAACEVAAQQEMVEQGALNNVNAAQARLMDLRDQLSRQMKSR